MGLGPGYEEYSPFATHDRKETLAEFAERSTQPGFFAWRDAAPMPSVFDAHKGPHLDKMRRTIAALQDKDRGMHTFVRDFLMTDMKDRRDQVFTPEVVLHNPMDHLTLVGVTHVDGAKEITNLVNRTIFHLGRWLSDPRQDLAHTVAVRLVLGT